MAAAALLFMPASVRAQPRFYVGLALPYTTIDGDFDGQSALVSSSGAIVLPNIDPAIGFGLFAGFGPTPALAFELGIQESSHDGHWAGLDFTVRLREIQLDVRVNLVSGSATQPYVLAGLVIDRLVIDNGSTNGFEVGDGSLRGVGQHLGIGLDQFVTDHFSIGGRLVYRILDYSSAKGLNISGKIQDGVNGNGLTVALTTAFHF